MNEVSVIEAAIVTICMTYIVWWIFKLCRRLKRRKVLQMRKTDIEIANEDIKEFQEDLLAAHQKIDKLDVDNEKLKTKLELAMSQNYCTMCGNILDGYVPPKKKLEGLE